MGVPRGLFIGRNYSKTSASATLRAVYFSALFSPLRCCPFFLFHPQIATQRTGEHREMHVSRAERLGDFRYSSLLVLAILSSSLCGRAS
jgi:hypothetical protein